jgi:ketosteroid isomerase-like protein
MSQPHANEVTLRRLYESFLSGDDSVYRDELIDIVANDRLGVAIVRHHLERDGEKLTYALAQVWRIADGKLAEYWEYPEPTFYHAWR